MMVTRLSFPQTGKKMKAQHEAIEKGSFSRSESYISEGYSFYKIAHKKLIGRNFYNIFEFATLKNILMLIKLKTWLTHQKYVQKFFRNPHLQMAYTFRIFMSGRVLSIRLHFFQ